MKSLKRKIQTKTALVGVIGLGYVGLPLVLRFLEVGFRTIGFDIDSKKIARLERGQSYIKHIPSSGIQRFIKSKGFEPTDDFSRLDEPDCLLICVPTPLTVTKEPDLTYVVDTANQIAKHLRKGQIISLESTTYPGTTEEILLPRFERKGFRVGRDFFLVFSPEREDPGNIRFSVKNIPKVVGGITHQCGKIGKALYSEIADQVITVSSARTAELTKLLENVYRAVNIALVNELKVLSDRMDIDIWEVIEAASTKPFGFTPFYPGPGLGGHCIPIDPFYLSWKAKQFDFTNRFIELAGEVNTYIPYYVVSKIADALNERGKSLKGSRLLILGVAYKKDVDDIRESPALKIMELLGQRGVDVLYNDPYVARLHKMRRYDFGLTSKKLTETLLRNVDGVVIVTNHTMYDYDWIVKHAHLVIDTRNATKGLVQRNEKIIKA